MAKSLFAVEGVTRGLPRTLMSLCGKMSIREQMISTRWRSWLKVGRRRRENAGQRGRGLRMTFTMPLTTATRREEARNERHGSRPANSVRRRNHDLRANQSLHRLTESK